MDTSVEPPACSMAFSAEAGGLHYSWRRANQKAAPSIGVYNVQTEQWTLTPTTGDLPPGLRGGGCAILKKRLYCFGGFDGSSRFNDLHALNLESFQWSKVHPKNKASSWPIRKTGCGLLAIDDGLVCFGGFGDGSSSFQLGSTFTETIGGRGYTNEFHLFDVHKGVWSSPQLYGKRPPPCDGFSFNKVDQDRAVFFGGNLPGYYAMVEDLYIFNIRDMMVTQIKPTKKNKWPREREGHAACCLNYGEKHPKLLISGGMSYSTDDLNANMWILDVDKGKWTMVNNSFSVNLRCYHSITATSLGFGLTEVLVFGGREEYGTPMAETIVLRFERTLSMTGSSNEEWALMDTAQNDSRGSSRRLIEKREKIRLATCPQSSECVPVLPRNWTAVTNGEMEKPVYQYIGNTEMTSSIPPGYPLYQTPTHPDVTFFDKPQKREFPSTGSHVDFNSGVEVTIPPCTIPPGSTVGVKVHPAFAPSNIFVMPEGIRSASPSYLISSEGSAGLNGVVTVTMEHHVRVPTREEADDLLFLQADSTPSEEHVYKYQEVKEGRSEFTPGENKGRLTTNNFSEKFMKIGLKFKKWFKGTKPLVGDCPTPSDSSPLDRNVYTVRVYRSPPQTIGDRLAIICVSLSGKLYEQFLHVLDSVVIPRDYPEVSSRAADKTVLRSRHFKEPFATLHTPPLQGWSVCSDKKTISKSEADEPETEKFKPQDLHDYPPRIISQLYPDGNSSESVTSTMSLTGLIPEVEFLFPLSKPKLAVDTTKLQVAAEKLRNTVLQVDDSLLSSAVKNIVFLMERMTDALRSSSLSELATHTDSIKTQVQTVLAVSTRVTEECTIHSISESIGASLSKVKVLSHQLCQVAKVKLKHSLDQAEKIAALVDLVESGTGLLRTVDYLLRDMQTLSVVVSPKVLTVEDLKRRTGVSDVQLDSQIIENDLPHLAGCFDEVDLYLYKLELTPGQQTDIKDLAFQRSTTVAMATALKLWRQPNPFAATFRALLEMLLDLKRGDVAICVCQHIKSKVPNY